MIRIYRKVSQQKQWTRDHPLVPTPLTQID